MTHSFEIVNLINSLFLQKKGLSLSHLVLEIIGPQVGLLFHQNVAIKMDDAHKYKYAKMEPRHMVQACVD